MFAAIAELRSRPVTRKDIIAAHRHDLHGIFVHGTENQKACLFAAKGLYHQARQHGCH